MSYYVQRNIENGLRWDSTGPFASLIDAQQYATTMELHSDLPEALRLVDDTGQVCGWVSRNGHKPGGALKPQPKG